MAASPQRLVAVDVGGTFTDLVMYDGPADRLLMAKVPSTPPDFFAGVVAAIGRVLPDLAAMDMFLHGTTMHLNAYLERKGARTALLTTAGFGDIYEMRRGNRVLMYDLHFQYPAALVPRELIFEVPQRMAASGEVVLPLDMTALERIAGELQAREVESVAICFLHSYRNPEHEAQVEKFLHARLPGIHVSASYRICREWREYERMSTTALNAYVSPILGSYLHQLREALTSRGYRHPVYIMQSTGGLMKAEIAERTAVQSLLSGPVGGNVASRALSVHLNEPDLVCIDMGGTSFDVSLVLDGQCESLSERELGGNPVLAPMVDIHTIGAGGGSIAWQDQGTLRVGPHSAGAVPGPACYGRGGLEATVTDANVVLGRIRPDVQFGGSIKLAAASARTAVERIGAQFKMNAESMADGILAVINAKMANAIRTMTIRRGIDVRGLALVAFGGAGPMHAVFIAEELGMRKIIVPNLPGAFSAWGMLQTDGRHDIARTLIGPLAGADWGMIDREFTSLEREVDRDIDPEVVSGGRVTYHRSVDLRYVGQEYFLNLPLPVGLELATHGSRELKRQFDDIYLSRYGHNNLAEDVEIVNLRVRARYPLHYEAMSGDDVAPLVPVSAAPVQRRVMFGGKWHDTPFYQRRSLDPHGRLLGPLVVEEESCTTVVAPGYSLRLDTLGDMIIELGESAP